MDISNLTGNCLKCVKQSAVSDDLLEYNCSIDFDHFDILASNATKFRLLSKKVNSLIKRDQSHLNKTVKSFPLNFLTENFIDRFRMCRHVVMNIETDKKSIVEEMYQLLNIYY